ncbi:MAG: mechanosensitive ion channel, partial [Lachnospiraceae bacterium]|nr:mechanosensitive ion channel [Lachnospiraceae bacterium]
IVFSTVFITNEYSKLKMLDQQICDAPEIVKTCEEELKTRSRVFNEDTIIRGQMGVEFYMEENGLEIPEMLDKIRGLVSAESVSLTDESGTVLYTTGSDTPKEKFENRIRTLEPGIPAYDVYTVLTKNGQETGNMDGNAYIMFPVEEDKSRSLVFEFSCEPLMEVYNTFGNWENILGRILSGLDAYAFVQVDENDPVGYPLDDLAGKDREQLDKKVAELFRKDSRFLRLGTTSYYKLMIFNHKAALAVKLPCPEQEAQYLIVMPFGSLIRTGLYCAITLSVFIVLNLILFTLYVLKFIGQKQDEGDWEEFRGKLEHNTRPGRILLMFAVGCFSVMLLMLESQSTIAFIATNRQVALQYDIYWHEDQEKMILNTYENIYRIRAQTAANILMEYEKYRTRDDLRAICDTMHADYLMLFDENGHELISSNSYTGFSVSGPGANVDEKIRAVLLGYPYAVVGPEKDPYTGKQQIGAAVLLTKDDGMADGFLLAVFNAGDLNMELDKASLENTVNEVDTTNGYKAAVIDNETGLFLAHTDKNKIGMEADLTEEVYGGDYAGFTEYDEESMYVSGVSSGGKSILLMVPDRPSDEMDFITILMIVVLLAVIEFLYCPKACVLCGKAMSEAMEKNKDEKYVRLDKKNPMLIFADGYAFFFTLLAGIALLVAYTFEWPAFTFVYGGMWSRGVHLFSLWAALFLISAVLTAVILIRIVIKGMEKRTNARTRTVLKLVDSFIAYAAGILLLVGVLYMFGVNTTALLASAGIVTIAVGMGAQSMVSDFVAGLFLAIEDSIHMGDIVSIGSWKGRVTDMGIRTTKITDENQNVMILNNSRISDVVNMSRKKTACTLELELERSVSMAETERILIKAVEAASEEIQELYGSLKLEGMHDISGTGCTARLTYECAEVERDSVTKRLQEFIKKYVKQEMDDGQQDTDIE